MYGSQQPRYNEARLYLRAINDKQYIGAHIYTQTTLNLPQNHQHNNVGAYYMASPASKHADTCVLINSYEMLVHVCLIKQLITVVTTIH